MPKQKSVRLETATGNRVIRAYVKTVRKIDESPWIFRSQSSAGFLIPSGQLKGQRKGYQVFVTLVKFDETLLIDKPMTGGLHTKP